MIALRMFSGTSANNFKFFGDKIKRILQEILKPGLGHPCIQAVQMTSREEIKGEH